MKALTIYQPWASLIAFGLKHYETRSWTTKYRGPLLIHAGQRRFETARVSHLVWDTPLSIYSELPFGKVMCIAELKDCIPADLLVVNGCIDFREKRWGDFSRGRFAWEFINISRFKKPWDLRGSQNIYNVLDELVTAHELEVV